VKVSDDGRMAYLARQRPGTFTREPAGPAPWSGSSTRAPRRLGLLLHGGRLFVSLFSGASVLELDPKSGTLMGMHQVPQGPAALATDAAGHVVVAGHAASSL